MEMVEDGGGRLSVVLAGHPKLRNDLRRPTMEEIGYRTDIFTLDGITGSLPAQLSYATECWRSVCRYDDVYLQLL